MTKITDIRSKIDQVDEQLARLFEQRMQLSQQVASYKIDKGLSVRDPQREQSIISRNSAYIEDEQIRDYYINFEKGLIDLSCDYQSRLMEGLKVAYAGLPGAFAHCAALRMFPSSKHQSFNDFFQAYEACEKGEADIAVLPLENSFAGAVSAVSDLMFEGSLYVNQVIELEASHCLLACKDATLDSVKDVLSHPQALAQCAQFVRQQAYTPHETSTTAAAAKVVAERQNNTIAAIASIDCAELYGLKVLQQRIHSGATNSTRFAAFSRSPRLESDKRSHFIIMFTVRNEAGSLSKALNIIAAHSYNMSCLRSRPTKEHSWSYYFFLELEGNIYTPDGQDMMRELGTICDRLKLVGTY